MTLKTGSEQYMIAIEYAKHYIECDILSTAIGFLNDAIGIRHDLETEAALLQV